VFLIIRNIFIIRNGILLLEKNFGDCWSFGEGTAMMTGFISAFNSFSVEITDSLLKSINFEDFTIYIYKDPNEKKLLYILITDIEDDPNQIQFKLEKIASLFKTKYGKYFNNFRGNISYFETFSDILIEMNVAQKNCGGYSECIECPNREKYNRIYQALKKGDFSL